MQRFYILFDISIFDISFDFRFVSDLKVRYRDLEIAHPNDDDVHWSQFNQFRS